MMGSWWLMWMVFMFVFLVTPVSYGWGYRGWGPPYPRHIQRWRGQRAALTGPTSFNHHSWSWGGDVVWLALAIGIFWAAMFWWH